MLLVSIITPLRLDFNRTIGIDHRYPQTYGFWWKKYVPEEEIPLFVREEEKEPKITVAEVLS